MKSPASGLPVVLIIGGLVLSGCAVSTAPLGDVTSSICRSGRPAIGVTGGVEDVFHRLLAVASPDLRGTDVRLTVVSAGTEAAIPAWSCGSGHRAEIVLLRETIEDPRVDASVQAHIIGHEIAHVVLHHPLRSLPRSYEPAEAEADELSVKYLVRAGYDWLRGRR